jgi:hypothetical protein
MTRSQSLKVPPLHCTLEAFADTEGDALHVRIRTNNIRVYSRVCDHIDKLAGNKMGSRQGSPYSGKHKQDYILW